MSEPAPEGLSRGLYAIAKTKRKRYLWCAWWTMPPTAAPFRPPDAWGGGARTEAAARELAERAAGRPLDVIDGHWAGAWKRILAGYKPFPSNGPRESVATTERSKPLDPFAVLGIGHQATLTELKIAFRKKALEHHPDHGGSEESFIAVKRAYDSLSKRRRYRSTPSD